MEAGRSLRGMADIFTSFAPETAPDGDARCAQANDRRLADSAPGQPARRIQPVPERDRLSRRIVGGPLRSDSEKSTRKSPHARPATVVQVLNAVACSMHASPLGKPVRRSIRHRCDWRSGLPEQGDGSERGARVIARGRPLRTGPCRLASGHGPSSPVASLSCRTRLSWSGGAREFACAIHGLHIEVVDRSRPSPIGATTLPRMLGP